MVDQAPGRQFGLLGFAGLCMLRPAIHTTQALGSPATSNCTASEPVLVAPVVGSLALPCGGCNDEQPVKRHPWGAGKIRRVLGEPLAASSMHNRH